MPEKPPLYEQETRYSCAAACLRMVLATFDLSKTEEEIRGDCDATIFGTFADDLVKAAKKYEFTNSRKDYPELDGLRVYLQRGLYPIVYVGVRVYAHTRPEEHAAVVIEIDKTNVHLLDPARGQIALSHEEFEIERSYLRRLTILIER